MVDLFTKNLFGKDVCRKDERPNWYIQFILACFLIYMLLAPVVLLIIFLSVLIDALASFF